jgi:UDP-glucose 4-epimerase
MNHPNMRFIRADCRDYPQVLDAMQGHDLVWHMAANTDIISGHARPDRDLQNSVVATFNVVEAMRQHGIEAILFASSGAVYGQLCFEKPVSESIGPLMPMSAYAAGKIGSEAFISCYCCLYGLRGWIFRFGNVLGSRLTHGVIFDFIRKLNENPRELLILGDGTQEKSYFLTEECIAGMAWAFRNVTMSEERPCDVFNLGNTTVTSVTQIARIIIEEMELSNVRVRIQGCKRAWPGDQPKVHLTLEKINHLGWRCERSSDEAVRTAVRRLLGKEIG